MYGCRDAGVNWEISICEVMIAIVFVQGMLCFFKKLLQWFGKKNSQTRIDSIAFILEASRRGLKSVKMKMEN